VSAPLTFGGIIGTAFRLYRRYPARVALTALVIFAPLLYAEHFTPELLSHPPYTALAIALGVAAQLGVTALDLVLTVLYAGLMDETVEPALEGRPVPSIRSVLRRLPYVDLVVSDVLVAIILVVGLILLIVPGVIAATLLCIVGPVVIRERRRPVSALRRSAQLVRPRLGLAAAVLFIPQLFGSALEATAEALFGHSFVVAYLVQIALHMTVEAISGLALAVLGHLLLEEKRHDRVRPGADHQIAGHHAHAAESPARRA
jgi:hypothetical protein